MTGLQAPNRATGWIIPGAITLLAIADGVLHFALDFVLFGGSFIGSPQMPGPPPGPPAGSAAVASGPPPGPPPMQFPLPLNELFLLNAIGYIALVAVYWTSTGWLTAWRWLVDAVLIVYTALSIAGWVAVGRPNPHGLGYVSKAIEIVLIVLLLKDALATLGTRGLSKNAGPAPRERHPAA